MPRLFIWSRTTNSLEAQVNAVWGVKKLPVFNIFSEKNMGKRDNFRHYSNHKVLRNQDINKLLFLSEYSQEVLSKAGESTAQYIIIDVTRISIESGELIAKDIPIDHCLADGYIYLSASRITRFGPTFDWMIVSRKILEQLAGLHRYLKMHEFHKIELRYSVPLTRLAGFNCAINTFTFKFINIRVRFKNLKYKIFQTLKNRLSRASILRKIERKVTLLVLRILESPNLIPAISAISTKVYQQNIKSLHLDAIRDLILISFLQQNGLYEKVRIISRHDFILKELP